MTWLALCELGGGRLSLRGLGMEEQEQPLFKDHPETVFHRGTIMLEAELSADPRPKVLFAYRSLVPNRRSLTFQTIPGGGIAMVQVQGEQSAHATIQINQIERTDVSRIIYSWDSEQKWGRITLERPNTASSETTYVNNPLPLRLDDIRALMLGQEDQTFARGMIFAAFSDQIEPIGPMPSLLPSTPISTPWGNVAVANLKRGDTVNTHEAGVVPILHTVSRVVPARGCYQPIRLRAPYFDLREDIIVSPEQRLLLEGPEVEYLFGKETVLVAARFLVNGVSAFREACGPTICYAQLVLPDCETLLAAGTTLESLYIGRIRRRGQQLHSSILKSVERSLLPEHMLPKYPNLRWYDAAHLASRNVA